MLIWSTVEGQKAESTLKPPSDFEHNNPGLKSSAYIKPPTAIFFNNTGIQYKISWKKQDNTGQKLPKYSEKLRNTGQKSRKYQLCMKNENIQNLNASYGKMTKNINVYECRLYNGSYF